MANTILTEGKTPSIPTPPSPPTKPIGDVKVKLGLTPTTSDPSSNRLSNPKIYTRWYNATH